MPVLLRELIAERGEPLCVRQESRLCDALKQMLENDYSQLPVVDQHRQLTGLVSEQSIARTYFNHPRTFSLDLTVNECSTPPEVMGIDEELSQALDRIKDTDAIVIVDEANKPVGILTDYDTTHFLRDLFEAYTLLEDIEITIGDLIERIMPAEEQRQAALFRAFGADRRDSTKPRLAFDKLTLHEKTQLIMTEENWSKFESTLHSRDFFDERMQKVGDIRNRLMHFQGKPDSLEYRALKDAAQWAKSLRRPAVEEVRRQRIEIPDERRVPAGAQSGKYDPLCGWLKNRPDDESAIQVKFDDLEKLLGAALPPTAYEHPSWWANVRAGRSQSKAWLDAGWRVADVDFAAHEVTFQRLNAALNQQFFADLLERLKKTRPGVTQASKTQPYSWFWFGAGRAGVSFGWAFHKDEVLSVELALDSPDKETNKRYFAKLLEDKEAVETEIGTHLLWEERQGSKLSRVRVNKKCKVTDQPEELERAKVWALDMILKFIDAFKPRIKNL